MKAVIYARVSSDKSDIDNSIQAQVRACKEYADKKKLFIDRIYEDRAESGRVSSRPEFQNMISDAKKKQFSVILVHKFDRFSRNREDAVIYKALLRKCKVNLISVTEPIGDDLYGKLIEGILEVTADFYSSNLGLEVKKGQKEIFERGFFPAGKIPFGYRKKEIIVNDRSHCILEPDLITAPVVKRMFELSASGAFLAEILLYLRQNTNGKYWDISTISRMIDNRVYLGETWYKKQVKINTHPAIVDEELFQKAKRKRNGNIGRCQTDKVYPLTGVLFCSLCGEKYGGNTKNRKKRYYICGGYRKKRICTRKLTPADLIENKVKEILVRIFSVNLKENINSHKTSDKEIKLLKSRLYSLQNEQNNIVNAISQTGYSDVFKSKIEAILNEKKEIEIKLQEAKKITPKERIEIFQLSQMILKMKPEKLKDFYRMILKIYFNPIERIGRIEITEIFPQTVEFKL